jgi:hypothetical protein
MSGLGVVPIKLFKLSQYHSSFVRFEAIVAKVVVGIWGGRQECQGTILDRAKTIIFSTASATNLRLTPSCNQEYQKHLPRD